MRLTLLLLLLAAPLAAQASADQFVALPPGYLGLTFCRGGEVEVWQRRNAPDLGLGKVREEAVLRHEMIHAEQYQQRGCATMDSLVQIPDSAAVIEGEAYCAELRVFAKYEIPVSNLWGMFILYIMRQSGARVEVAHRALAKFCGDLLP